MPNKVCSRMTSKPVLPISASRQSAMAVESPKRKACGAELATRHGPWYSWRSGLDGSEEDGKR